jgi:hypothetical protein
MGLFEKGALVRHFDPINISGKGEGKRFNFDPQNILMGGDVFDLTGDLKSSAATKKYKQDVDAFNAQQAKKAANIRVAEAASSGKKLKKGGKVSSSRKCSHNRLY